jgi:hypothetical protein
VREPAPTGKRALLLAWAEILTEAGRPPETPTNSPKLNATASNGSTHGDSN